MFQDKDPILSCPTVVFCRSSYPNFIFSSSISLISARLQALFPSGLDGQQNHSDERG